MSTSHSDADRRPLASRRLKVMHDLAQALAHRGVSANAVSVFGLISGVLAGAALAGTFFVSQPRWLWLLAAGLVQLRLLANMIDGLVAIEAGQATPTGPLYNEVPDRITDAATLIGLGYAQGGQPWLGFLAAVLAVFTAYVRAQAKVTGAPQDFCGPMAKPHRMFMVTVTAILCAGLPTPWVLLWPNLGVGLASVALIIIVAGCMVTAIRRLIHAGLYLTSSR